MAPQLAFLGMGGIGQVWWSPCSSFLLLSARVVVS
jgi:hypothetical protein